VGRLLVPQALFEVGPEFVKQIRAGICGDAQRSIDKRVSYGTCGFRHPGVLDKARAVRTSETPRGEGSPPLSV
jgi:hypothetical protein